MIAYFDCFNGVAGDMILGGFIDVGLPIDYLKAELDKLKLGCFSIKADKVSDPISGTDFKVIISKDIKLKHFEDVQTILNKSALSDFVKGFTLRAFERLRDAEAKVHGVANDHVHFHELASLDTVVDVVGAAVALEYFKFDAIYSSPIPFARGTIKIAHGELPSPAPATVELLKGVELQGTDIHEEIVTPTGALLITSMAKGFGDSFLQKIDQVGYGYGDQKFEGKMNALRVFVGDGFPIVMVEANIDDMNPQVYDYIVEGLFKLGAVDVTLKPIQMKKSRPGVTLSCISAWKDKDKIIEFMLKETTTFGVRYYDVERKVLTRTLREVVLKNGSIRVKQGFNENGTLIKEIPEYEDVKEYALKNGASILAVYSEIAKKQ